MHEGGASLVEVHGMSVAFVVSVKKSVDFPLCEKMPLME
jgi:hypothetical protein